MQTLLTHNRENSAQPGMPRHNSMPAGVGVGVGVGLGLGLEAGLWHIADMHVHDIAKEKVRSETATGP